MKEDEKTKGKAETSLSRRGAVCVCLSVLLLSL
jgi:hypothetical protein